MRSMCAVELRACASPSITGPTSVASRRGSPTRSSSIAPRSIVEHAIGDVLLHAQDAQRRAALAGAVERGGERVGDDLLGSAELSTIIAFWPPVSAISTGSSVAPAASAR